MAGEILAGMAGLHGVESTGLVDQLAGTRFVVDVTALLVLVNVLPSTWEFQPRPRVRAGLLGGAAAGIAFLFLAQPSPFIYYQF